MSEPGGERQDPRLDAAAKFVEECWGHEGWAARAHAADFLAAVDASVPVGGAPRDDDRDVFCPECGERIVPRDDQNDDDEALPDGRGFTDEQVERGAKRLWDGYLALGQRQDDGTIRPEPWETSPLQDIHREIVRAVLDAVFEPGANSAASPNPDSGAAPKGEQEENLRAMYDAWKLLYAVNGSRMVGYVANAQTILRDQLLDYDPFLQKHDLPELVSPPPDRLTDEEVGMLLWASAPDTNSPPPHPWAHLDSAVAKLKARLSDREPEKP